MLSLVNNCPPKRTMWCGPTALGALLGCSYTEAVSLLEAERRRRNPHRSPTIKGTFTPELLGALYLLGYRAVSEPVRQGKPTLRRGPRGRMVKMRTGETLAAFLDRRTGSAVFDPMLVLVTNHFIAVEGEVALDTSSRGRAVDIRDVKRRRALVEGAWRVTPRYGAERMMRLRDEALSQAQTAPRISYRRSDEDIAELKREAGFVGLVVTMFKDNNGCVLKPDNKNKRFHFGASSRYQGAEWFHNAMDFCRLEFDPEELVDVRLADAA